MGRAVVATALAALLLGAPLPFPLLPASAGGDHTAATTLLPNREFAPALLRGIRDARRSIVCCYYLFKMGNNRGNLPRRIAEELIRARQRGVEVTVILETQGGGSRNDRLDADNHATAAYLTRGGVRVFFDSPSVTTHTKATVIDDRYVLLGSHNLTQGALTHNNELSVLIDSPEVADEVRAALKRL
ncbi:MAG TPA: phospholipase D-like domain-containing protein [Geobacteraceae bacterium]